MKFIKFIAVIICMTCASHADNEPMDESMEEELNDQIIFEIIEQLTTTEDVESEEIDI